MKLTRMLLSSRTLGHGTIRHFSDGDFAVLADFRESQSYMGSLRSRRSAARGARGESREGLPSRPAGPAAGGKKRFWPFLQ